MGYLYLALAIIAEVAGTAALKASAEFTKLEHFRPDVGHTPYPACAK
jgi:multidrug transporter EmrE-like cation transporter